MSGLSLVAVLRVALQVVALLEFGGAACAPFFSPKLLLYLSFSVVTFKKGAAELNLQIL